MSELFKLSSTLEDLNHTFVRYVLVLIPPTKAHYRLENEKKLDK